MANSHIHQAAAAPDDGGHNPLPKYDAGRKADPLNIELLKKRIGRKTKQCTRSLQFAILLGLVIYGATCGGLHVWALVMPLRSNPFFGIFKDLDEFKWATFIFCCHWMFFRIAMMVIFLVEHIIAHLVGALTGWGVQTCLYDTIQELAFRLRPTLYRYSRARHPTVEREMLVSFVLLGAFWLTVLHLKVMEVLDNLLAILENGASSHNETTGSSTELKDWGKMLRLLLVWFLMLLTSVSAQTFLKWVNKQFEQLEERMERRR